MSVMYPSLLTTYHHTYYSQLTPHNSPLTSTCTTYYLTLTTHYSLLTTHYLLLTTYYLLLTTHYLLPTTYYLLLITYYLLLTTYYKLLTINYLLCYTQALQLDGHPEKSTTFKSSSPLHPFWTAHFALWSTQDTKLVAFDGECLRRLSSPSHI